MLESNEAGAKTNSKLKPIKGVILGDAFVCDAMTM
jgi:hypothetical protein